MILGNMSTASYIVIGLEFVGWSAAFAWLGWQYGFKRMGEGRWWQHAGALIMFALIIYAFRTHISADTVYETETGITQQEINAHNQLARGEGVVMLLFGFISLAVGCHNHRLHTAKPSLNQRLRVVLNAESNTKKWESVKATIWVLVISGIVGWLIGGILFGF